MKTKIVFMVTVFLVSTIGFNNSTYAGDKEWRRFGEAAAILWGVRALTGWDPAGSVIDYPRRHVEHRRERAYQQPTDVYRQNTPPRNEKISAFPPNYYSTITHQKQTQATDSMGYPTDLPYDTDTGSTSREYPAVSDGTFREETPYPNRDDAKPSVLVGKRVEGNYEIETTRIWIAPHWEKKVIDGHWRGDTWVDTHTEKKWVEGTWKEEETRKPLGR